MHTDRVESKKVRANPAFQVQNTTVKEKLKPFCFKQDCVEKEVASEKGKDVCTSDQQKKLECGIFSLP